MVHLIYHIIVFFMHNTEHNILSTQYTVLSLFFRKANSLKGSYWLLFKSDFAVFWRIFITSVSTHQCHVLMRQTSNKQVWKTLPPAHLRFPLFQIHLLEQEGIAGICSLNFMYCRCPFSQLEKKDEKKRQIVHYITITDMLPVTKLMEEKKWLKFYRSRVVWKNRRAVPNI